MILNSPFSNTRLRHPSVGCLTRCDRGQKKLALNSESPKKRTTSWGIRNFLESSVPFDFHPGNSRTFGLTVRFSKFQQFPDFLEIFLRKFPNHYLGNMGRMGRAQGQPCEVI